MNTATPTIFCSDCGKDLTTTGNSIDYRLVLKSEEIPGWGGAVTDMLLHPAIEADLHFCHLDCLRRWAA